MTSEEIMKALAIMDTQDIIELWNECIEEVNYPGDRVYGNNMLFFEEMFAHPYDVAIAVTYGDWIQDDNYVVFNGYGNISSFNYWGDSNSPIDLDVMVEWLSDNKEKVEELWPSEW